MKLLVTGAAGFIGYSLARDLCQRGDEVIGIDSLNDYYDVGLKRARLQQLETFANFSFQQIDIVDAATLQALFRQQGFERVVHMAAQAGVRYSLVNPAAYIESNLVGFANLLECCRQHDIEHLVYASSSSVYGANRSLPFSTSDNVDHPISLYAASKKANELMAHSYSHLYRLPSTGLRFFTVYGPWGRPDMSPILFADAIMQGKSIQVFNQGRHRRDFTYIDDIVSGVIACLDRVASPNPEWDGLNPDPASSNAPWRIYNIGRGEPVELLTYIDLMEQALGKRTSRELLPAQPGDVEETYADISALSRDTGYKPTTTLAQGLQQFARWYLNYYAKK
ncbi:MAG: NAD-dependent epimerase [Gammaproteobacteria bacterium]|nr:MAG: NAD-dependent epimerase [Gammaproteobacteria bacterium]